MDYLVDELKRVQVELETVSGKSITEADLLESIAV